MAKDLALLGLNEVNFELVEHYVAQSPEKYPSLNQIIQKKFFTTTSETEYEQIEPWIQWPSIQTGEKYKDHKIFRLGDIVNYSGDQIYEKIERRGYSVGAVSPMNADNRLEKPSYFIPDPWTETKFSGPVLAKLLYRAVKQAVGDNAAGKITLLSKIVILLSLIRYSRLRSYRRYAAVLKCFKSTPGVKALFLDLLLNEVHLNLYKNKKPNFTHLFLNSFAHIQHHYFFKTKLQTKFASLPQDLPSEVLSGEDPFPLALKVYDWIVGDYYASHDRNVVVATGLRQIPYDRVKYYYRLLKHEEFLISKLGIQPLTIQPLMTRDFVVNFGTIQEASDAELILASARVRQGDEQLFAEIQNKGTSLFVSLTYGKEIDERTEVYLPAQNQSFKLLPHVAFVAVKNGMHDEKGYVHFAGDLNSINLVDGMHVSELAKEILNYFPNIGLE